MFAKPDTLLEVTNWYW